MSRRRPRPSPKRRTIERLSKQATTSRYVYQRDVAHTELTDWQETQQLSPFNPGVRSYRPSRWKRYSRGWWLFNGPSFFVVLFLLMGASSLLTLPEMVLDIWRQFDPQTRIFMVVVGLALLLGLGNLIWQVRRIDTHIAPGE